MTFKLIVKNEATQGGIQREVINEDFGAQNIRNYITAAQQAVRGSFILRDSALKNCRLSYDGKQSVCKRWNELYALAAIEFANNKEVTITVIK